MVPRALPSNQANRRVRETMLGRRTVISVLRFTSGRNVRGLLRWLGMKLRIRGDSLRLRLGQTDMAALDREGRVAETIHFGPTHALVYAIETSAEVSEIEARWSGEEVTVVVPSPTARRWIDTNEVGLEHAQSVDDTRTLAILIEKDFQCLVPREGEGDPDGFPNPAANA